MHVYCCEFSMYGQRGVNWRQIYLCSKFMQIVWGGGGLIIEGGIMLSEYRM